MKDNLEKLFSQFKEKELPLGLFERIILAIEQERELRQSKKILFSFLFLLVISLAAIPFSFTILIAQIGNSGILYFISSAISDFGSFVVLWKDFGLAIIESLPLTGLMASAFSLGLFIFTLRLFLYKKRLLWGYLKHSFA